MLYELLSRYMSVVPLFIFFYWYTLEVNLASAIVHESDRRAKTIIFTQTEVLKKKKNSRGRQNHLFLVGSHLLMNAVPYLHTQLVGSMVIYVTSFHEMQPNKVFCN